jgi:hypothetical protein
MAKILVGSINLDLIPKEKVFKGKKGKYLNISVTVNDEQDQYGNDGPITVGQTKEEREAKKEKIYLGNVKTVWTNEKSAPAEDDDLPF